IQGSAMFDEMIAGIREGTARMILTVRPRARVTERKQVMTGANATLRGEPGKEKVKPTPVKKEKKVGPNDPCPCGSGKKYKKCHGSITGANKQS
ncbi:MAG: SEC-C domain-containing protein, partial [Clostridia bacterium]|nr:SEC-C domain-containing protein [Clostridia bacterium]